MTECRVAPKSGESEPILSLNHTYNAQARSLTCQLHYRVNKPYKCLRFENKANNNSDVRIFAVRRRAMCTKGSPPLKDKSLTLYSGCVKEVHMFLIVPSYICANKIKIIKLKTPFVKVSRILHPVSQLNPFRLSPIDYDFHRFRVILSY